MPDVNLNRRSILGGLAAATAFVATNHADAAANPDAELIRLGKEFDRLRAEYIPLLAESNRLQRVWIDECDQRGVLLQSDCDNGWAIAEEVGSVTADRREEPVQMALDETTKAIFATTATTLAGFAVKAKTLRLEVLPSRWAEEPTESEYEAMDWDEEMPLRFLFEIERMAGA
ncbi:hypothetical protein [Mesorhizobium sp.]|uniref:hypothetical protein n=1 Tax=Mesorhizobium sp. TaxID=1871066 RepID=UPI000FE9DF64|nr:hypothetical protein [Mesorhizobium sp.]RWN59631.1 MAG: hypothetical protein EOS00_19370 [Mesorhizobium sp.]